MDNLGQELTVPGAKIIRMPSLKRGRDDVPLDDRVKLERVLGLTVGSNAALDCNPLSEQIAYPAGCTVVLFNIKKNKQSHILNVSRKTITCLAFGSGGKFIATGECGHAPSLRIWNVQDGTQMAEFQGHKYGINCVAFSPNNKYVVSIGSQHDMIVNVWDWKNNIKVASNKVSTKVKAVSFSENGKYFVTVGMRNVKFWYLEHNRSTKYNDPVPLTGRSAILGEQRDNYFCDVACGRGKMGDSTYSITKSGLLCEFSIRRMLDKWVELRTKSANCMTVGEDFIFVGCADGIIRCFSPVTLEFLVTLPRTHYLGVDVALGLNISHLMSHPPDAKYPDAIALTFDETNRKLTCVYNDHSLYVWDVREIRRVGKSHSFLYHSACIWGVEVYPEVETQEQLPVPSGSFITCSSDDTIRVWNLNNLGSNNSTVYKRNIYSNELLKVLYVDKNLTYLKDLDLTISSSEKVDTSYDGKNGVRSVRISPDGQHLASGDREGNIRIHELNNLQQTVIIEAHDAEVLCLEYTKDSKESLLASASRDRLIHVFNVSKGYECMQTLDDHSSSITSVRFINTNGQLQMISCSADKSIIFRQFQPSSPDGVKQFARDHNVAGKTTLYDMEVDCSQKHILTACQDRNIRVYNVNNGKHSKTFKGSMGEDGTLIKVSLDNSGIYVATSCTDKSLSIYDYYSGECMATMLGHSELVTGLRFTNDCKKLISASGDGCIFIWRLPRDMTVTMQARLDQQAVRKGKRTVSLNSEVGFNDGTELVSDEEHEIYENHSIANMEKSGFRFSVSQLPAWARREIEDPNKGLRPKLELTESPEQPIKTGFSVIKVNKPPQGRWAQRIENNEIMIATFSPDKEKNGSNELNSKDSSLESQLEKNNDDNKIKASHGGEGIEFDGDVEDSDVETETHYYPISAESNSEFTVTANNMDELRRYARKYKKQHGKKSRKNSTTLEPLSAISNPATSVSGSQDSDDEDLEDVSSETETPSIERSLGFGVTSASTESLDLFGQRETYFKNNYESLNADSAESRKDISGKSITSQYLVRNSAVLNAAKQTKSEIEKMKKREELKKRLEDTRRTLKISGMPNSPLKASQSTCDLTRCAEKNANTIGRNRQINKEIFDPSPVGLRLESITNNYLPFFSNTSSAEVDKQPLHKKLSQQSSLDSNLLYNTAKYTERFNYKCGVPENVANSEIKPLKREVKSVNSLSCSYECAEEGKLINLEDRGRVTEAVNFSFPLSPVSIVEENTNCLTDSGPLKYTFYPNIISPVDKKKAIIMNQKKKEKLLLAHDRIGYSNLCFPTVNNHNIEECLNKLENSSNDEFSSDSLESESLGSKSPRKCVSEGQLFFKKNGTLSLCSGKNSEDLSDTDISGFASLQGSGDILEMLGEDLNSGERSRNNPDSCHGTLNLDLDASFEFNESNELYHEKLNNNIEKVKNSKKGPKCPVVKKADAFFVELNNFKKLKPKKESFKRKAVCLDSEKISTINKPLWASNPVIWDTRKKKKETLPKKLPLKSDRLVLPNKISQDESMGDEEGLRRAISLSDLSASPALQSSSSKVSGTPETKLDNSKGFNNNRTKLRGQSMIRCSSVGVLNRMDGNTEMLSGDIKKYGIGKSLMRPTISSQNKVAASGSKTQNVGKRRGTAFSSVNLTGVGVNDDSSSEETFSNKNKYSSDKNNIDFNQRRQSNLSRYGSLKDLSNKAKEVTQRLSSIPKKNKNQEKDIYVDIAAAPLTKQLCSSVSSQLNRSVENLILLHKRLTLEALDASQSRSHFDQMIEDLEKLAIDTQQKLSGLTSKLKNNNNSVIRNQLSTNTSNFLGNNLGLTTHNNVSSTPASFIGNANNANLMANVDVSRISEMLISVVQQYTENQQNSQKN